MSTAPAQPRLSPTRRGRIADDRGRLVPLLTEGDVPRGASTELRVAVVGANAHRLANQVRGMAVAAVIVLILYPIVLLAVGRPIFRWVSAPGLVTGLAVGMTTMAIVQGARVKARVQDAVRQCLGRRLCPSCGYDLAGLEAGADGCTVCPECGAAWRLAQSPSGAE